MKKIIRLTESDLTRIVRRVIQEQELFILEGDGSKASPFSDAELQIDVDKIIDDLDGWVDGSNLNSIYTIIMKYKDKFAVNNSNPNRPITVPALRRLADLYKMDENGDNLLKDLQTVGTRTLNNDATTKKIQVINILSSVIGGNYQQLGKAIPQSRPQKQGGGNYQQLGKAIPQSRPQKQGRGNYQQLGKAIPQSRPQKQGGGTAAPQQTTNRPKPIDSTNVKNPQKPFNI